MQRYHHGVNMKKALLIAWLLAASLVWLSIPLRVSAQGAVVNTPTALPDGRIVYKVKANDTCLSISLLEGVTVDQLRQLNSLDANCTIREGQELLLGRVQPTATPFVTGPTPTPTPLLPTSTPFKGTATVCFFLYKDANGDGMRQEDVEQAIPDGAINMTDRLGKFNKTVKTAAGTDPVCINEVPEGDYNISVAPPEGYNPTTSMNYALKVAAGDSSTLDFGAQPNSAAPAASPSDGGHSPVLGILGGALLVGGIGLGVYMRKGNRA
jgi:hypothetical protein